MIHWALIAATAAVLVLAFGLAYYRTRDPFHPLIMITPMFATLYVYLPATGLLDGEIFRYLSTEQMAHTQTLFLCGCIAFCGGCLHATFAGKEKLRLFQLPDGARAKLMASAWAFGLASIMAWLSTIVNAGGFTAVYSNSYGIGESEYGYVRDAVYFSIPAIVLLLTSRLGTSFRVSDLLLTVLFSSPMTVHGILGARRAPIFMAAVAIGFGWYIMRRRRPNLGLVLAGGFVVGYLMLFLVSNRDRIHLGSDFNLETPATDYLKMSAGNEFTFGSAAVIHADRYNTFYWGRRYFAIVFVRPIPVQLWPDKYEAIGMGRIRQNLGVGYRDLRASVGWEGARGAAPGLISDLYVEWSWLCLVALYLIGWVYGWCWRLAVQRGGFPVVLFVLLSALSLFMVLQTLEAMLVRVLWMAIPARIAWALSMRKHSTQPSTGQRQPFLPHAGRFGSGVLVSSQRRIDA